MATQTLTAPPRDGANKHCETTLLGQTYPGRPMGLALSMRNLEQAGNADKAIALLDAHNRIRMAFGQQPYDLSADFTDLPMEGGFTIQAVPTVTVTPRPLNERLWELVSKETARTIAPAERVELDALCVELEGAAA
jgi:hypothetical protein